MSLCLVATSVNFKLIEVCFACSKFLYFSLQFVPLKADLNISIIFIKADNTDLSNLICFFKQGSFVVTHQNKGYFLK